MSEAFRFFYTNGVRIAVSSYDVTISFQRRGVAAGVAPSDGKYEGDVLDQIDVGTSVAHAKSMAVILLQSVLEWEKLNGVAAIPEKEAKILRELPSLLANQRRVSN